MGGGGFWIEAAGIRGRPHDGQNHAAMEMGTGGAGVSHRRWPGTP